MTRLEDILHDNGYEQLYIEGSKGEFSLYDKYVGRYEDCTLFDRKTASDQGYTDESADYMWKWGIEDRKLFDITKELITDISKQDKPFFVTMYTMDTHTFESGHRCPLCDSSIRSDYLASVDCCSRQTAEFVEWLRQQPFFENTTLILVGDHLGNEHTTRVDIDEDYVRTTYNCFINPAKTPANAKNRVFSSLDMFPTTLSAIGAEIKGNRLGLGTDLFSDTETLAEMYGEEEYKNQLEKTSDYYKKEFY
jgi:phosphoglycerol transferase